jgi:hypothetical protein
METTECSETSAFNNQTPGKYPEENIPYLQHGENLKTTIMFVYSENHAKRMDMLWKKSIVSAIKERGTYSYRRVETVGKLQAPKQLRLYPVRLSTCCISLPVEQISSNFTLCIFPKTRNANTIPVRTG